MRILLIGLYGWLGLSFVLRQLGQVILEETVDLRVVSTLVGLAHLPVVLVALAAQVIGVMFDFTGPGVVVVAFAALVWMPGQLIAAIREVFRVDTIRAAALVGGPYALWLATVGVAVMRQIGHLL